MEKQKKEFCKILENKKPGCAKILITGFLIAQSQGLYGFYLLAKTQRGQDVLANKKKFVKISLFAFPIMIFIVPFVWLFKPLANTVGAYCWAFVKGVATTDTATYYTVKGDRSGKVYKDDSNFIMGCIMKFILMIAGAMAFAYSIFFLLLWSPVLSIVFYITRIRALVKGELND